MLSWWNFSAAWPKETEYEIWIQLSTGKDGCSAFGKLKCENKYWKNWRWRIRFDRDKNDKVYIIRDLIGNPQNCQNLRWPPSRWSWSSCAWPMLCWWNLIQRRQDWITVMLAMKICWIWNNFLTLELAIFHNCYLIHSIINWLQVRSKY